MNRVARQLGITEEDFNAVRVEAFGRASSAPAANQRLD
jgi:acetyl-CoA acetyltransferase